MKLSVPLAMPAEVGVSMKAHMELVSQVTYLQMTLAQMQSTLAQSVTERAQLRGALTQTQSTFAQSSTALTAFQEQVNRCTSLEHLEHLDKRLRKVEFRLPHSMGQVKGMRTRVRLKQRLLSWRKRLMIHN